jgi:hypothetical protein
MLAELLESVKDKLKALIVIKPQRDEDDPDLMAFVGAPLKPRPPLRSSTIAVQPEP